MIRSKRSQAGQALVEMAIVIPILLLLTLGFVGVGVMIESRTQVQAALTLATASATQAPLGDRADALKYADNTFSETMSKQNWIRATFVGCSGSYMTGKRPGANSLFEIKCTAKNVAIVFSKIGPLTMLWPQTLSLGTFTAVMFPSTYRSCKNGQVCS